MPIEKNEEKKEWLGEVFSEPLSGLAIFVRSVENLFSVMGIRKYYRRDFEKRVKYCPQEAFA